MSASGPKNSTIVPRTICEIYKTQPSEWKEATKKLCIVEDVSDFKSMVARILDVLIYQTAQYFEHTREETFKAYSVLDINTVDVYACNVLAPRLKYEVTTFIDHTMGTFKSVSDLCTGQFRPLFKEYELFLIENILTYSATIKKQYFNVPFLLGLQRCIYIWFLGMSKHFELRGSTPLKIYWAVSKPHSNVYDLYSAVIDVDFDFTEIKEYIPKTSKHISSLRVSLPYDLQRSSVEKKEFTSDDDFFTHFWEIRIHNIHGAIRSKISELKQFICTEDISDVE